MFVGGESDFELCLKRLPPKNDASSTTTVKLRPYQPIN